MQLGVAVEADIFAKDDPECITAQLEHIWTHQHMIWTRKFCVYIYIYIYIERESVHFLLGNCDGRWLMADVWWLVADGQMLIAAFQIIANILHLASIF